MGQTGRGFGLCLPSEGIFSLALLGHFTATPTSVSFGGPKGTNAYALVKGDAQKHEGRVRQACWSRKPQNKGKWLWGTGSEP